MAKDNQTLVFIDDSGDAGFKFGKGSSDYFVILAVIFYDNLEAEKTAVKIKELRRELGFPDSTEFKFFKSRVEIKRKFLETVNPFDFKIRCLVVNKKLLYSDELKNSKNSFYSYMIKTLLSNSNGMILDARIKLDGSGDRIFRRNFSTYLRRSLNSNEKKVMSNLKFVDSKEDVLIQLADMLAGTVRRSHESKEKEDICFKQIIKRHIEDEWLFK